MRARSAANRDLITTHAAETLGIEAFGRAVGNVGDLVVLDAGRV